jgi:DNA-binding response OmpR family regulator
MENPGEIVNILIIDDSRFVRLANQRALTHAGHHTISSEDGELGLEIARERHPDVILLDMMLPKLSGPDVLRALKRDARNLVSAWIAN